MKTIDANQLKEKLDAGQNLTVVEALPGKYYQSGHIPGALHLPHDQVQALAGTTLPDKAAPVVVYCASDTCENSHLAAAALQQLGYHDVSVFPGGKAEWQRIGLPLVTDSKAKAA